MSTILKKRRARAINGLHAISKLRPIGNSKGVILNSRMIEAAGFAPEADIVIRAAEGVIIIEMKAAAANASLSGWDKQFKAAFKKGALPEGDLFSGIANDFDVNEW